MISYAAATRNAIASLIATRTDAGSGNGKIRLKSAGGSVVCEVALPKPAFGDPTNGQIQIAALSTGVATSSAPVVSYDLTDSDNNVVFSGTVATVGGDLNLKSVDLTVDDEIEVDGFTYVAPE